MIRVVDLHCGYPGRKVLHAISFHIRPGEFVGILGPNGSGKTTLLLSLTGVLPVEKGLVEIQRHPLSKLSPKERARRMAVVLQDTVVRFPFPCEDVVAMGRFPHRKRWRGPTPEDAAAVERAMNLTKIRHLARRPITAVSGGERQRVLVAKALAQETPILLLDEATSAMDVRWKLQTFNLLKKLQEGENRTIVAVLHDINLAAVFCRRLIFLKEGRIAADGPTSQVLVPEVLERIYGTRAVVYSVPGHGVPQVFFDPDGQTPKDRRTPPNRHGRTI